MQVIPLRRSAKDIARKAPSKPEFRPHADPAIGFATEVQPPMGNFLHGIDGSLEPLRKDDMHAFRRLRRTIGFAAADLEHALSAENRNGPGSRLPHGIPYIDRLQRFQIDITGFQVIFPSVIGGDEHRAGSGETHRQFGTVQTAKLQLPVTVKIYAGAERNDQFLRRCLQDAVHALLKAVERRLVRNGDNGAEDRE